MSVQITQTRIIEAILFASDVPVEAEKLVMIAGAASEQELLDIVDILNREYEQEGRVFRIVEVAGGYQYETLPQYGRFVEQLFHTRTRPKLSRASLETLAIVSYKQPISRAGIEALRGVDSDAPLRTLINRDLIEITGRSDAVGKPMLYGTTQEFLRYFGLKDIKDLPGADELASMFDGSEIEQQSPDQLRLDDSLINNTEES
ncbi:MAG: SMC-Scp complex subunit ScpB [Candidatus Latescibacteria bacterium]|nr:SMC-Scp complex subunit ScpB [Candidatus Latescibacterota bacterium]